ncbi:hypothetical protein FQA39_LY08513 [Lamprigera yunnana]|nr:hypothetical protein FQA39_LY08513 [Lamprigera yunnana]
MTESEVVESQSNHTEHNFLAKCKLCGRENSLNIVKDSNGKFSNKSPNKFQSIVTFDCRGMEPVDFDPRTDWLAKVEGTGKVYSEIDLSEKEWVEYDSDIKESIDLNSDIEDNNKRRRIQKIYISDEDEEVDTILKRPPQLITESTHLSKRPSAIRKNTSSATSSIAAVDDVNSINVKPTTSTNKEFTSDDYSTTIVPTLSSTSDAVTSTPKQEDAVLGLLKQIIRKQNIIQAILLQLVNGVNDLKTNQNVEQKLVAVNN